MRRLSQRAWNNVLIFAMLILIFIFNFERFFPAAEPNVLALVGDDEFVLSMQINQLTFERIGTGWRVSAPSADLIPNMQSESIDNLINRWQSVMLKTTSDAIASESSASPPYLISLWLAGQKEAKVLGLLQVDGTSYAVYEGDLFILESPDFADLLPPDTHQ